MSEFLLQFRSEERNSKPGSSTRKKEDFSGFRWARLKFDEPRQEFNNQKPSPVIHPHPESLGHGTLFHLTSSPNSPSLPPSFVRPFCHPINLEPDYALLPLLARSLSLSPGPGGPKGVKKSRPLLTLETSLAVKTALLFMSYTAYLADPHKDVYNFRIDTNYLHNRVLGLYPWRAREGVAARQRGLKPGLFCIWWIFHGAGGKNHHNPLPQAERERS